MTPNIPISYNNYSLSTARRIGQRRWGVYMMYNKVFVLREYY